MKFFTTQQLGPKRFLTPEGFLVCQDVPIARTGDQLYKATETGTEADRYGMVTVERREDDVFRAETIASFQGKPVTWDHPSSGTFVFPHNYDAFAIGTVLNPRRGTGDDVDCIIADLVITKMQYIDALAKDLRDEVSSGYEAEYETLGAGRARQFDIIGNHVAIVPHGRCGTRCSIQDEDKTTMKNKPSIFDALRAAWKSKDEAAFDAACKLAVTDEAAEGGESGTHVHLHMPEKTDDDDGADKCAARFDALEARIAALEGKRTADEETAAEEKRKKEESEAAEKKKAEDAAAEEEAEKKKKEEGEKAEEEKKKTTDSAPLSDEFQQTVANAEILVPGVRLPTFDAKVAAKSTSDAMCELRRRTLDSVFATDAGRRIILQVTGGVTPDIAKMDCAAAALVFNGAAAIKKSENRTRTTDAGTGGRKTAVTPQTPAEMNEMHRAHYGQTAR